MRYYLNNTAIMTKSIQFEKSMEELETLVTSLEAGDLPLEEALKHYEKGIALARKCQTLLQKAEQKIEQLTRSDVSESGDADE